MPGFFCAVNAAAIAPKRVYTTRDAAIAAADGDKPVFERRRFYAVGRLSAAALRWSK